MIKQQTRKHKKRNTRKIKRIHYFSKNDFGSGDGMLTSVWGPTMWHTLHTISFNYPVNPSKSDKRNYRNYILQLKYVLPCKYCRMNLLKNLKVLPLTMNKMKSRETFSRYIYELHELINKMLNKKSNLTYEDICQRYEHFRARCNLKFDLANKNKTHKKGCVVPFHKVKSKGIVKIVPHDTKCESLQIDNKCFEVN
jgi:hypothetical protein